MPVNRNEESGVHSWQTSNCFAGIPIKKRRFPLIPSPSPPREDPPSSLPEENDAKNKEESGSGNEPPPSLPGKNDAMNKEEYTSQEELPASFPEKNDVKNEVASSSGKERLPSLPEKSDVTSEEESSSGKEPSMNATSDGKPDLGKSGLKEVKTETPDVFDFAPDKASQLSGSKAQETGPANGLEPVNNIKNKGKYLLTEKGASSSASGSNSVFSTKVKKQMVSNQAEGNFKLELSVGSRNAECSLGPIVYLASTCGYQQSSRSPELPDKIDSSLLSLSSSNENPLADSSRENGLTTARVKVGKNRSNWDLNTTMDTWYGSSEDACVNDTICVDGLNKPNSGHEVKPSLSSNSGLGISTDKGKQALDSFETRSNLCVSTMSSSQHYKSEDSLRLTLNTSFSDLGFSEEYSASSTKAGSSRITSNSNLHKLFTIASPSVSSVKSEPVDGNSPLDLLPFDGSPSRSSDPRLVKREIAEGQSRAGVKLLSVNPLKLVESRTVKSEVGQEVNQETSSTTDVLIHQSIDKVVQHQESCSSSTTTVSAPLDPRLSDSSTLLTCSELSANGVLPNQPEHLSHTEAVHNNEEKMDQPAEDMISEPASHQVTHPIIFNSKVKSCQAEDLNFADSLMSRFHTGGELDIGLQAIAEGSVSEEEKLNISADVLDDDAYCSDYESDGNHSVGDEVDMEVVECDKEENEYEDGEVRETLIHSPVRSPTLEVKERENDTLADGCTIIPTLISVPGDCSAEQIDIVKDSPIESLNEKNDDHAGENIGREINGNSDQIMHDDFSLHSSVSVITQAMAADKKRAENEPLHQYGEKSCQENNRKALSGDGATNVNGGTAAAVTEVPGEIVQGTNMVGNADSSLSKAAESSLDGDHNAKVSVAGGSRSRIINLPRASNQTPPSRIRSAPARSLSSRSERERYSDLGRDSIHHRGKRDDSYADIRNKFPRDRMQDKSFRNLQPIFMRGRGRITGRLRNLHGDWEPNHDFAAEGFDGPSDYRFTRHSRAPAVPDAELECDDFVVSADQAAIGAARGGKKPSTEELYSCRHPSSRRISPGARGGPSSRSTEMFRRLPRSIGETGSDHLSGLRHEKKFIRGFPHDMTDPIFSRTQAPHKELDGQFIRGNRKFSTVQRRGFPRARSKSPINACPRSPRPWLSPRIRFTDGFNSLSDQSQHRSPAMCRVDRMRSPDRVGYSEGMDSRRHVSPRYVVRPSNDIRDVDSARRHGHNKSINSGKASSDRVYPRSTRGLDVVDPRERADGNDYFSGPKHAGRSHETRGDGSSDERKKYGERRSPIRSFRATYSGNSDCYFFSSEDGSRPLRFRPNQDTGIFERSNIRERDFDALVKFRPSIAPARIRNIEEQEGSYRQPGQIWHDDTFSGDFRLKRRRF